MSHGKPSPLVKSVQYITCNDDHLHILCFDDNGLEIADICLENLEQAVTFNNDIAGFTLQLWGGKPKEQVLQ